MPPKRKAEPRATIVHIEDSDSDSDSPSYRRRAGPSTISSIARILSVRTLPSGQIGIQNGLVEDIVEVDRESALPIVGDYDFDNNYVDGFRAEAFDDLPEQLENTPANGAAQAQTQKKAIVLEKKRKRVRFNFPIIFQSVLCSLHLLFSLS